MPALKTLHDALSHSDFSLGSSLSHFSFLFFLLSIGLALAFRLGMRWVGLCEATKDSRKFHCKLAPLKPTLTQKGATVH